MKFDGGTGDQDDWYGYVQDGVEVGESSDHVHVDGGPSDPEVSEMSDKVKPGRRGYDCE